MNFSKLSLALVSTVLIGCEQVPVSAPATIPAPEPSTESINYVTEIPAIANACINLLFAGDIQANTLVRAGYTETSGLRGRTYVKRGALLPGFLSTSRQRVIVDPVHVNSSNCQVEFASNEQASELNRGFRDYFESIGFQSNADASQPYARSVRFTSGNRSFNFSGLVRRAGGVTSSEFFFRTDN